MNHTYLEEMKKDFENLQYDLELDSDSFGMVWDFIERNFSHSIQRARENGAKEAYKMFLETIKQAKSQFSDSKEFQIVVDTIDIERSLEALLTTPVTTDKEEINKQLRFRKHGLDLPVTPEDSNKYHQPLSKKGTHQ